jgi:hypothetical protein
MGNREWGMIGGWAGIAQGWGCGYNDHGLAAL